MKYSKFGLLALSTLLSGCTWLTPPTPELRGLWVDAFGPGIKKPTEIDQLVLDAKKMNVNVIFAQFGRRGDCYCNKAAMPRTDDPEVPAGFDPLQELISKAHAQGIQVHAWIITTAIWNNPTPPIDPRHAFNTHGPNATGRDNWLMVKADGSVKAGNDWMLDPGHPQAAEYIKNMYVSVAQNYDIDGVQFDRVRYPDFNPVGGPNQWGYNPVALERFYAETDVKEPPKDPPHPSDVRWTAWRRQQVTNLVRETALAVKAIKPQVSVNAATITYGPGPSEDQPFQVTRPYAEVGQDWFNWVKNGYLDINVMMNYKRDFNPEQAAWFNQWNAYAGGLRQKYPEVQQVSGSAIYLNDQQSTLRQIEKTRLQGLSGWAGYSYRTPDLDVNGGTKTKEQVLPELIGKLSGKGGPFERPAPWPKPVLNKLRAVRGQIEVSSGPLGGRLVRLLSSEGKELARTETNGLGQYGFMRVPEGKNTVSIGAVSMGTVSTVPFQVEPGKVKELETLKLP